MKLPMRVLIKFKTVEIFFHPKNRQVNVQKIVFDRNWTKVVMFDIIIMLKWFKAYIMF